ncbi:hypothetical protein FHS56_000786 [Thermonema lapsum]|uniref:DUF4835 domain-containing protein n=1 Tax=Thermonema lapsum TaxID=28195 RepID=A0A846MPI7_9BACT|nr:DUF4835 family protein [Thermonema lapsum]NIK73300.1 hypothetical protein [Thermonema lapsum]
MQKKVLLVVWALCWGVPPLLAQELNCRVIVNDKQMQTAQTTERAIFREMEQAISLFMNERQWGQDNYLPEERIGCTLEITLIQGDVNTGNYQATAQIRALRPVYDTDYETPLLIYVDRQFNFRFQKGQQLIFNENVFSDDLTAMLAYYAYFILAMDGYSFAEDGGEEWVQKMNNLVNLAQTAGNVGWRRGDVRNRYWLAENLLSQQLQGVLKAYYNYHRKGLDYYVQKPEAAVEAAMQLVRSMGEAARLKPNALLVAVISDTKAQELASILKTIPAQEQKEVTDIFRRVDPPKVPLFQQAFGQSAAGSLQIQNR